MKEYAKNQPCRPEQLNVWRAGPELDTKKWASHYVEVMLDVTIGDEVSRSIKNFCYITQ